MYSKSQETPKSMPEPNHSQISLVQLAKKRHRIKDSSETTPRAVREASRTDIKQLSEGTKVQPPKSHMAPADIITKSEIKQKRPSK